MRTIITMKYNNKSSMPLIYAERYGIVYTEIRRENEDIFINIPIDEYITDIRRNLEKKFIIVAPISQYHSLSVCF